MRPSINKVLRTQALAREHCKQFGKAVDAVSANMPGILPRIVTDELSFSIAVASNSVSKFTSFEVPTS
ncbi:hypothetical protein OOZ63_10475 [Paucibacter sp. PLA-PC-4]|nr:hypothetical protein [Paucibacter sp. PLA-PC-4]